VSLVCALLRCSGLLQRRRSGEGSEPGGLERLRAQRDCARVLWVWRCSGRSRGLHSRPVSGSRCDRLLFLLDCVILLLDLIDCNAVQFVHARKAANCLEAARILGKIL
jgi:hypothetical protein